MGLGSLEETRWPLSLLRFSAETQARMGRQALCPEYSHEFPDHVSGDELDGLWLVLQAQGRERLPNGMLISEEHDGAVALGLRLWGQEGQLRSCSAHILRVHPNFLKGSLPRFLPAHPVAEKAGWGPDLRTTRVSGALRKQHTAWPLTMAVCVPPDQPI